MWAAEVGNSWRTAGDISDTWDSMTKTMDIVRYELLHSKIFSILFRTINLQRKLGLGVGTILTVSLSLA
jgi:hypothetical protein